MRTLLSIWIALTFAACTGAPVSREPTLSERLREDHRIGDEVAVDFESRLLLQRDVGVSVYLRSMAQRIAESSPELTDAPLGVFLIRNRPDEAWKSYALPGNRLYLSVAAIKRLEFETELAALIANLLADILNRHAAKRLLLFQKKPSVNALGLPQVWDRMTSGIDYFSSAGVFSFTDEERLNSAEVAVSLLYRAGYDPRGLVKLWERHRSWGVFSPIEPELLTKLEEKSRDATTYFAPLRNPVVRSDTFLEMKQRIERL